MCFPCCCKKNKIADQSYAPKPAFEDKASTRDSIDKTSRRTHKVATREKDPSKTTKTLDRTTSRIDLHSDAAKKMIAKILPTVPSVKILKLPSGLLLRTSVSSISGWKIERVIGWHKIDEGDERDIFPVTQWSDCTLIELHKLRARLDFDKLEIVDFIE